MDRINELTAKIEELHAACTVKGTSPAARHAAMKLVVRYEEELADLGVTR